MYPINKVEFIDFEQTVIKIDTALQSNILIQLMKLMMILNLMVSETFLKRLNSSSNIK